MTWSSAATVVAADLTGAPLNKPARATLANAATAWPWLPSAEGGESLYALCGAAPKDPLAGPKMVARAEDA
jgi:hypothetical protein